jgi:hypothetical protein
MKNFLEELKILMHQGFPRKGTLQILPPDAQDSGSSPSANNFTGAILEKVVYRVPGGGMHSKRKG